MNKSKELIEDAFQSLANRASIRYQSDLWIQCQNIKYFMPKLMKWNHKSEIKYFHKKLLLTNKEQI